MTTLPGRITATGIDLPETLTFDQWRDTMAVLGDFYRGLRWAIVDAYLFGERKYGELAAQYAESVGWAPHTLLNACSVARAFPPEKRHPELSFGHHEAVAVLLEPDRDHLLRQAATGQWSVAELRAVVRENRDEPSRQRDTPLSEAGDALYDAARDFLQALRDAEKSPGKDRPDDTPLIEAMAAWTVRRRRPRYR